MAQICHAHSARTGKPCRQPVVSGKTVCYYHGGAPGSGRPPIHGRYSKAFRQLAETLEAYERHRDDPTLMELKNEIALLRTIVERHLERYGEQAFSGKALPGFVDILVKIGTLVEKRHKLLYGEAVTLTVRDFEALLTRVIDVARTHFGDHPNYPEFIEAIGKMGGTTVPVAALVPASADAADR